MNAPPDTQWVRYEVFQQVRPGAPFANVGSVHAPDPEIAMQNARDVFVRRPQTYSLWVAPAEAIFSRTAQQIEREGLPAAAESPAHGATQRYLVFRKTSQRRAMTYVVHCGEVVASSAGDALRQAVKRYSGDGPVYVWWLLPADVIVASGDDEVGSMFQPAHDKSYRMPTAYRTQTMMRELEARDDAE